MTEGTELPESGMAQDAPKEEPREVSEIKEVTPEAPETAKRDEQAASDPEALVAREGDHKQAESIEKGFKEVVEAASAQETKDNDPAAIIDSNDSPKDPEIAGKDDRVAIGTWPTPDKPEPGRRPGDGVKIDTVPLPEKPLPEETVKVEGGGEQVRKADPSLSEDNEPKNADFSGDRSPPVTREQAVPEVDDVAGAAAERLPPAISELGADQPLTLEQVLAANVDPSDTSAAQLPSAASELLGETGEGIEGTHIYQEKLDDLNELLENYQDTATALQENIKHVKEVFLNWQDSDMNIKLIDYSVANKQPDGSYKILKQEGTFTKGAAELLILNMDQNFAQIKAEIEDIKLKINRLSSGPTPSDGETFQSNWSGSHQPENWKINALSSGVENPRKNSDGSDGWLVTFPQFKAKDGGGNDPPKVIHEGDGTSGVEPPPGPGDWKSAALAGGIADPRDSPTGIPLDQDMTENVSGNDPPADVDVGDDTSDDETGEVGTSGGDPPPGGDWKSIAKSGNIEDPRDIPAGSPLEQVMAENVSGNDPPADEDGGDDTSGDDSTGNGDTSGGDPPRGGDWKSIAK